MIRNTKKSEIKHCKYCGARFPEDSLNDINNEINIIVCESCGTENKIDTFEIQDDKKKERSRIKNGKSDKNRKDLSSQKKYNRQIRLYVFRTIYEMLKDPEYNFDIKENQNELTEFQLNRLAIALRKKILDSKIPEEWLDDLNIIKKLDFKEYYENLQLILSSKRQFKEVFLRDFQKAIEFAFELLKGKLIISELETEKGQEYTFIKNKKEIAEDLIERFGFLEDMKLRGNFEIFLKVFISRYIYDTIKDPKFESVMGAYKGELTMSQIDKLALSLKTVFSCQYINDEWFENFSRLRKRSFLKNYQRLQTNILTDHLYSVSFLDYLKYLIRLVDGLINGKNVDSELKKSELIIARDLRSGDPFQSIGASNPLFKPNLLIVLGRIVYLIAKTIESDRESNEAQANRLEIDADKILNQIMPEIASKNKINDEFLKKLNKISKEDFQKDYAKLKVNLKSDQICYAQVSFYLKWVIETVLNILSRTKPPSKFSIIEKTIVRDLKNYPFDKSINNNLAEIKSKESFQLHCEIEQKEKKSEELIKFGERKSDQLKNIFTEKNQIVQKCKQIESDQSRLGSNAVADNADIFAINRDIEMYQVQKIQIPYSERLFEICQLAKRLRNRAVFIGRQTHFFRTRKNYSDLPKRYPDLARQILTFMETKLDDPDLSDELKRKFENPALELSEKIRKALGKFEQFASLCEFLKFESVYKDLNAIYSPLPQQVLKYVAKSWSAYYEGHASWVNNPEKFEAEPRTPSTKRKVKEFLISFPAGTMKNAFTNLKTQVNHYNATRHPTRRSEKRKYKQYKASNELLLPSTFLKNFSEFPKIRTTIELKSIVEVRIVPKKSCYEVQIVYKKPKTPKILDDKRAYSIDIGVNELIALTNNFGEQSVLIRGRPIKAVNQWMHKKIGALRSVQTRDITFKKGDELPETQEMYRIRRKRDNIVYDYFHKSSRFVIDRCLNSEAKNLSIGYNSGWKKNLLSTEEKKMGHKQRQNFAYIPFLRLIEMIRYKAELVGINVKIIREPHTSKCSSVDFESIEHQDEYMGLRGIYRRGRNKTRLIKKGESEFKSYQARGLFRTKDGHLIHSDVNASYNIGRRAFPDLFNENTLSKRAMLKSPISVQIV